MAYVLEPGRRLQREVRRVATERLDEAIEHLERALAEPERTDLEVAVHEARKRCKSSRGLARLVRPALGDGFRSFDRTVRDAANQLSALRDAHAIVRNVRRARGRPSPRRDTPSGPRSPGRDLRRGDSGRTRDRRRTDHDGTGAARRSTGRGRRLEDPAPIRHDRGRNHGHVPTRPIGAAPRPRPTRPTANSTSGARPSSTSGTRCSWSAWPHPACSDRLPNNSTTSPRHSATTTTSPCSSNCSIVIPTLTARQATSITSVTSPEVGSGSFEPPRSARRHDLRGARCSVRRSDRPVLAPHLRPRP